MEYKPGGASGRKGGKKRKKASAKEDDDEADEEEKPKKKLKSEVSVPPRNWLAVRDGVPRTCCRPKCAARVAGNYCTSYRLSTGAIGESLALPLRLGRVRRLLHPLRPRRRVSSRGWPHKIKHGSLTVFIAFLPTTGQGGRRQRHQGQLATQGVGQKLHHRGIRPPRPDSQERKGRRHPGRRSRQGNWCDYFRHPQGGHA
jgi:hypothetical protein